jgi:hypothetical protein
VFLYSYPATAALDLLKTFRMIEVVVHVVEEVAEGVNVIVKFNFSVTHARETRYFQSVVDDLKSHAVRFDLEEVFHDSLTSIIWKVSHVVLVQLGEQFFLEHVLDLLSFELLHQVGD